jgi:hypothetical protein
MAFSSGTHAYAGSAKSQLSPPLSHATVTSLGDEVGDGVAVQGYHWPPTKEGASSALRKINKRRGVELMAEESVALSTTTSVALSTAVVAVKAVVAVVLVLTVNKTLVVLVAFTKLDEVEIEIEVSVAGVEVGTSGPRKGVPNSQALARLAHDDAMKRIVGKRNHKELYVLKQRSSPFYFLNL